MTRFEGPGVGLLGLLTIAVYGSWYYSFGVLLDPIITDTGWREATLATGFGVSILIGGLGAIGGGWLLDRLGSRAVFLLAGLAGGISFTLASLANEAAIFAIASAVGGGVFGALGFYHITQTVAVRIRPASGTRAIAMLTIWGAFASVIYIPLTAFLVQRLDWRMTLRVVTLSAALLLLVAAVVVVTKPDRTRDRGRVFGEVVTVLGEGPARRFLLSQGLTGMATAVVLAYQVPAMTSAGLTLAAASFWAGFRGFSQLAGRIPLMPIVDRVGVVGTMRLAYLAIAIGVMALAFAGTPFLAAIYALATGFGVGAFSPLTGMFSRDLFGTGSLGTAMGTVSLVFFGAGSLGPPIAGFVSTATGSRTVAVAGAACLTVVAAILLRPTRIATGES